MHQYCHDGGFARIIVTVVYSIRQLSRATGVTVRALRHHFRLRVIEPPPNRGPHTRYTEDHFVRVLALKALRRRKFSLAAIRDTLAGASNEELFALAGLPKPPREIAPEDIEKAHVAEAQDRARLEPTPETSIALQERVGPYRAAHARQAWTRVTICPGVELHVSAGADDEALRVAREIEAFYAR